MNTISVNLYSINELEPKAKEKALNKLRKYTSLEIFEQVSDLFRYSLEDEKLDLIAQWSLSYCQGDGVAFEGSLPVNDLIRLELISKEDAELIELDCIDVKLHGRCTHKNSMSLLTHFDNKGVNSYSVIVDKLEMYTMKYLQTLSEDFERKGYELIDYLNSDEYLIEQCEANEWTFEACGRMRNE